MESPPRKRLQKYPPPVDAGERVDYERWKAQESSRLAAMAALSKKQLLDLLCRYMWRHEFAVQVQDEAARIMDARIELNQRLPRILQDVGAAGEYRVTRLLEADVKRGRTAAANLANGPIVSVENRKAQAARKRASLTKAIRDHFDYCQQHRMMSPTNPAITLALTPDFVAKGLYTKSSLESAVSTIAAVIRREAKKQQPGI